MYVKRELEDKIAKYLSAPEIIAIIGPRQSGKTTLLKKIFKPLKGAVYLDFEDRETLELFNNDIKSFYNLYCSDAKYLFIDEFQYAREGGKGLKYLY
ncbi:AAA family ATPase, partial [bacterium]|nr:AAA family ATPase [bacterium]